MSVRFILSEGRVERGRQKVQLTPRQAALLGMICKTFPEPCHREPIGVALYPYNRDPRNSLGVEIHKLRLQLRPIDLRIELVRGYGYRVAERVTVE